MKVSVAMATFNGGPYLAAQLASISLQDRLPDELVISDDGSSDETEQLVKEYAGTAPFPVIWLRNRGRRGYQNNIDYALAATIGDVILLADQDDVWLQQHVSRLATPFEARPQLMVTAGDSRIMDATGALADSTVRSAQGMTPARVRATNHARGLTQFRQVLTRRGVLGHNLALRRRVLELAAPFPTSWMHDEWIFMIGAALGPVLYVDDVLSSFRRYARDVPGPEYRRVFDIVPGPSGTDLLKWQHLLSRLRYAGALLPSADQALHDVAAQVRLLAFRTTVREQPTPVRAVRALPWLLAGRFDRPGSHGLGFRACARDLTASHPQPRPGGPGGGAGGPGGAGSAGSSGSSPW